MNDSIEKNGKLEEIENMPAPTERMILAHRITLTGYWGLVVLIPIWNLLWFPSTQYSNKTITVFWLIPLLFPMFGLLKGKAYTHAWSGFIAVIYICHALASLVTSFNELLPILLELVLSTMFLLGGTYFARWRGIQLGLQLPKKK